MAVMEKKNPQDATNTLITILNVLLWINLIALIVWAIVEIALRNYGFGIGLLLAALVDGLIIGLIISALRDAFYAIIECLPHEKRTKKNQSTPAPDIMCDNMKAFRERMEETLMSKSPDIQIDWLKQWQGELIYLHEQEQNPEKKQVYQEELDFIALSISALE